MTVEQIDEVKQILRLATGKVECLRNELERDFARAMDLLDNGAQSTWLHVPPCEKCGKVHVGLRDETICRIQEGNRLLGRDK